MGIAESQFESEEELETWAFSQLYSFLGDCVTLGKFQILTPTGKRSIPDGFAFNFGNREWFLLEAELLSHGVWPHIAEQITRFVVSLQSPETLRKIRDRLFERIVESGLTAEIARKLDVGPERLLQQIELFVEGVTPSVVVFIDESSQDLQDFANALDVPLRIYRVKKFLVNGNREYYSPDQSEPVIETAPVQKEAEGVPDLDVISTLGGGAMLPDTGRLKCYGLDDGRVIQIKRSKFHEKNQYYWYGVNPSTLEQARELGVTHFVFVLGNWGFSVVDISTVEAFCRETKSSKNTDGSVRHYHILISPEPEPEMYFSGDVPRFDLSSTTFAFA